MGNCFCLPFQKPSGEICCEKAMNMNMMKPAAAEGKFLSPGQSTCPEHKRQKGRAIGSTSDATNCGIKKIRLLLTKQELRDLQLLSKAISVEEMLAEVHREGRFRVVDDFVRRWQPILETIPEAEGSE